MKLMIKNNLKKNTNITISSLVFVTLILSCFNVDAQLLTKKNKKLFGTYNLFHHPNKSLIKPVSFEEKNLCLAQPEVKGGNLTAEAFIDRLLAYFQNESNISPTILNSIGNIKTLRNQAKIKKCQYLLFTKLKAGKGTFGSILGKTKVLGGKYKIEVEYTLETVADNTVLLNEKYNSKDKNSEEAVVEVISKITADVLEKMGLESDTRVVDTSDGKDVNLPKFSMEPRLVVQTSHSTMLTKIMTIVKMENCLQLLILAELLKFG